MTADLPALIHLHCDGVSLLIDARENRSPAILHWGPDLGTLRADEALALAEAATPIHPGNAPDEAYRPAILPQGSEGWTGPLGISGARADGSFAFPRLRIQGMSTPEGTREGALLEAGSGTVCFHLVDETVQIAVDLSVQMLPTGLVRQQARLTNTANTPYHLQELLLTLPLPLEAEELLDFAGRWGKERTAQRTPLRIGTHRRENRRGRTGFDSSYLLHAGPAGFGFAHGELYALHTAFSGNHVHLAHKHWNGEALLGGGELLLPGEGILQAGEAYTSPWVYGAHGHGLDQIASRFHRHLRSRPHHVSTDRPMTLNVWEAVYFDHNLDRLKDLADRAAALGVERYVLDDGWFGSRRNDLSGLGDWTVSPDVWPEGLAPIVDHVTGLGMQFGLWFEPEMVNEDSDVARAHPEWIMGPAPDRLPIRARHQQVLNLTIPEAYAHVRDQMVAVLESTDISYIKWDHNRDLLEAGTRANGAAATHEQTLAAYRLMAELKERFPGLEIESCSSGGGRVDLGVLEHTDRVWVSDCIDPLERQQMNRWTSQLIPLELMGSHIASGRSHTTGRLHSLSFRAATALFGHLGIEWDLAEASAEELEQLGAWIALYKEMRELLFTGTLVRLDRSEDSLQIQGVVGADARTALFSIACLHRSEMSPRGRLRLRGLDPERRYRITPLEIGGPAPGFVAPAWFEKARREDGLVLSGSTLMHTGLATPAIYPEQAFLLRLDGLEA